MKGLIKGEFMAYKANGAASQVANALTFSGSELFKRTFEEGMSMVEETATYLDADGRRESQRLSRAASLAYATESMRLTTRLMQLASWLLLPRAVNEGDLSFEQADHERSKVKLGGLSSAIEGQTWNDLPERLRVLIGRSIRLQERVIRLDDALRREPGTQSQDNQVARDLDRLADAFGGRAG